MREKPTESEGPSLDDSGDGRGLGRAAEGDARVGQLRPGETWGKFLIEKRLDQGDRAFVYQAVDRSAVAGRVALKLPRFRASPRDVRDWLRDQAEPLRRLEHPAIVRVVDAGCIHGRPYTATPLTDALPLGDHLRARRASAGQIVDWAIDLAEALHAAHREGIVHGDLNPQNVLITRGGCPRIADFGLASAAGRDGAARAFEAPQQARREVDVDHRVDVFALGALIKYLLTGAGPYGRAPDVARAARAGRVEPIDPRRGWLLRRGLAREANRALAPLARDRHETAGHLARSLRRLRGLSRLLPMAAAVVLAVAAGAVLFLLLAD